MKFRTLQAWLAVALVVSSHAEANVLQVGELRRLDSDPRTQDIAHAYLIGLTDGVEWSNTKSGANGGKPIFCAPANFALAPEQAKSFILNAEGVQDFNFAGLVLLNELKKAFPCKQ